MSNCDDNDTNELPSGCVDSALILKLLKLTKIIRDHNLEWCDETEAWLSEEWVLSDLGDDPFLISRANPMMIKSISLKGANVNCDD
jgi:hypothetical protein